MVHQVLPTLQCGVPVGLRLMLWHVLPQTPLIAIVSLMLIKELWRGPPMRPPAIQTVSDLMGVLRDNTLALLLI